MKFLCALLLTVASVATAAPAAEAAEASARKKVDMILCRREDFDDCTVFMNIEKQTCGECARGPRRCLEAG